VKITPDKKIWLKFCLFTVIYTYTADKKAETADRKRAETKKT
jgi:hypothetical protein